MQKNEIPDRKKYQNYVKKTIKHGIIQLSIIFFFLKI